MFQFDLSTLDDRDITDTIEALDFLLGNMPGQNDNACFQYLLAVMSDEWHRRAGANLPKQHEIALPIGEATASHVWAFLKFAGAAAKSAAKGEPSAMGRLFGAIILEIEAATERITAAAMN